MSTRNANNSLLVISDRHGININRIDIRRSPANPDFVEVVQNGQTQFAGLWSSLSSITVDGRSGRTFLAIESSFPNVPTTVLGARTVTVGKAGKLTDILSQVTINNANALVVDDSTDTFADRQVALTSTSLTIAQPGLVTINYSAVSSLTYEGGPGSTGANTYHVLNTIAGQTILRTRGSQDFVQVHADQGPVTVGGFANNAILVGDNGLLRNILAPVSVANVPNLTAATLTVDNSRELFANHSVTFTGTTLTISEGVLITINYSAITSLTYEGGFGDTGANTYNVLNTPPAQTTIRARGGRDFVQIHADQGPVTVGGFATVNVGNTSNRLDGIQGPVTVNGQGGTTLNVNDQGTSTAKNYDIFADAVKRVLNQDPRTYDAVINYANIGTLTVNGSGGSGNVFFVEGTAAGVNTTINGSGGGPSAPEAFVIQADNNALFGPLTLHDRPGNNFVRYDDQADPVAQTYTLAAGTLSRSGLAPVTYDNLNQVILLPATVGGNTINVPSVAAGVIDMVAAANGDTVTIGANQSLASIQGPVAVGPLNINISASVVIDDSANATPPAGPITFSNVPDFNFQISGLAPERIFLGAAQNTTLNTRLLTGAGDKTFNLQAAPQGVALNLDAGSPGTNMLDYTGFAGNVLVSLPLFAATGFSRISNIQNVKGASGGPADSFNILVGNGGNVLTGGNGRRNLLIAGATASTLIGGDDDDILIGGTTAYDLDPAALQNIMAEWTRTDEDYFTRAANLQNGTGLSPVLDATTVRNNGGGNTLQGNAGGPTEMNLFYGLDPLQEAFTDWNEAIGELFLKV